jgi:ribosomal protein S18 acetylase RimI-like enzyme
VGEWGRTVPLVGGCGDRRRAEWEGEASSGVFFLVDLFAVPSYRFCRPDDIPLLVHAVETCYRVHDPEEPGWSAESFRRGMREIDLWPSNSMVALDTDGEPVAVMIGTKRADEVAVHRLGVRPDHLRRGHGVHLLTSLSQKLAVLGPERLVAEVPEDRPAALACFAVAG